MTGSRVAVLVGVSVAVLALFAGWGVRQALDPAGATASTAGVRKGGLAPGTPRPEFVLPDLEGHPRQVSEWDGRVLVVNFWATWCPPCLREIPHFIDLQTRYRDQGLVFVGIAIDEPGAVRELVQQLGVNYPVLLGDAEASEVSVRYGNALGGLPYTVVLDRQGRVALTHTGEVPIARLEGVVRPLLAGS